MQRECGYSPSELDTETGDTWKNYQLWLKLTRDPKPLTERSKLFPSVILFLRNLELTLAWVVWRNLKPKLENVIDMRRQYRRGSARPFAHLLQDVKSG